MAIDFVDGNPPAPTGRENVAYQADPAASPRPEISANIPNIAGVNAQTGTSYTVQESDNGKLVTFSNGSAVAVTIPAAGTLSAKFHCAFTNLGAGTVTLTPTTSAIDGAASLALTQHQGAALFSDATNYFTTRGAGSSVTLPIAESDVSSLVSDLALKATKVLTTKGDLATFDTVENRLGVGADGQILIADSAQTKGIKWGSVSGASGSATASGPYLVIGTTSYVFPMHACSLPDTSLTGFAWANQSNATAAAQSGALLITDLTTSAGTLHNLTKAIGTSTALIVAFIPTISGVSANQQMGLTFLESATGKMESLCVTARNGATASPGYALDRWTGSGTGFNSNQFSTGCPTSPIVFLKLQVSGSNIIFSLSADGNNFIPVRTEAKTAYFTTAPDKWGYILAAGGTGSNINMLVVSWEES